MKKGKGKIKKKSGKQQSGKKKTSPKKRATPKRARKALTTAAGAMALAETVGATDDPIGCCYWVDATGQNRFKLTTQSECKGIPNSSFRANKKCPGGGG